MSKLSNNRHQRHLCPPLTRGEKVREALLERLPDRGVREHVAEVALGLLVVAHVRWGVLEVAEALSKDTYGR